MLKIEVLADIKDAVNNINDLQKKSSDSLTKISKSFNKTSISIISLNQALELGSKIISKFGSVFGAAIDAASENEQAINSLNSALAANGQYTQAVSKDLIQYADELQNLTNISAESAMEAFAMASSMGVNKDQMKDLISAAADMSARFGGDLNSNVQKLGKSLIDGGMSLKRYGIEVEESNTRSGKLANAIKAVQDSMGGAAADRAQSFAGKLESVKIAYGDIEEAIGFFITKSTVSAQVMDNAREVFLKFAAVIIEIPKILNENQTAVEYFGVAVGTVAVGLGGYVLAMNAAAIATATFSTAVAIITSPITLAVGALAALGVGAYALYKNWDEVSFFIKKSTLELSQSFLEFSSSVLNSISGIETFSRKIVGSMITIFATGFDSLVQGAVKFSGYFSEIFGIKVPQSLIAFKDSLNATALEITNGTNLLLGYSDAAKLQAETLANNVVVLEENRAKEVEIELAAAEAKKQINADLNDSQLQKQSDLLALIKKGQEERIEEERKQKELNLIELEGELEDKAIMYEAYNIKEIDNLKIKQEELKKIIDEYYVKGAISKENYEKQIFSLESRISKERIKLRQDEARRQIEIKKKQDEQFYFTENAKKAWEEGTWLDRINQTKTGLDQLANLSSSSNKTIAAVGKAAAIARAIQDTYAGATAAYSSLAGIPIVGPGLGVAAAAAAVAAGMANVAAIRSNSPKFADGGIVGGNSFSGDQINARVNSGEMILNRSQQASLFNQISNGNNNDSIIDAIYSLGNRIANLEIVLKSDDVEIARSVNRAIASGYVLAS
jgi:hypothetical protein